VVGLASFNVSIPAGKSAASNWTFALTHPTILLHVIVATGVLVVAAIAAIMSLRSIGWAGAVIAYGTGWYLGRRKDRREETANVLGS
jgi:uncharacterized membrane protein YbjE (DUF340 family)